MPQFVFSIMKQQVKATQKEKLNYKNKISRNQTRNIRLVAKTQMINSTDQLDRVNTNSLEKIEVFLQKTYFR